MGVLPLTFEDGASWQSIGLKGDETVTIRGLQGDLKPRQKLTAEIVSGDGSLRRVSLLCRQKIKPTTQTGRQSLTDTR